MSFSFKLDGSPVSSEVFISSVFQLCAASGLVSLGRVGECCRFCKDWRQRIDSNSESESPSASMPARVLRDSLDNFEDETCLETDLTRAFFGFIVLLALTLAVEQS